MNALDYIANKYRLDLTARSPIEISNIGRDDLARLFAELGYTRGAEIGVEQGLYSEILCKANPKLHLYCIDAWTAYSGYREYVTQAKIDQFYAISRERLSAYNCELIGKFSIDAVNDFKDGSLDFVFIDGNHTFMHVVQDITLWSRKVRAGGIVSGHDYIRRRPTQTHVVEAVNGYTSSYSIHPWFLLGTRAKTLGQVRDKARSWMWVKRHA